MRALSILALVLSLLFLTNVASEPIFAATQKSTNNGNNGNNGDNDGGDQNQKQIKIQEKKEEKKQDKEDKDQQKEEKEHNKEQNKEDKNLNKEQNKEQNKEDKDQQKEEKEQNKEKNGEQNKEQVGTETDDPELDHGITLNYENMIGSLPIFEGLKFSVDSISFDIQWNGDENTSGNANNYRAKIDEGIGQITLEGVQLGLTAFNSITIQIKSIENGLFNEHNPENENGQDGLYLRAKLIVIRIEFNYGNNQTYLTGNIILEHPMIKIQDGELQFIKLANDDLIDQYLAPPRVENKQYTTFGKIKSAIE